MFVSVKLTLALLVAWIPIVVVFAQNNCRAKFELFRLCYQDYGTTVLLHQYAVSVIACARMCMSDAMCRSCVFNPLTKLCRIAMGVATSPFPVGCIAAEEVFYAEVVKATCYATWIGDACTSNADCATENSECYNGACRCKLGYSYKKHLEGCHGNCPAPGYGSTWTSEDHYLAIWNDGVYQLVPNLDTCLGYCLAATGYTCRFVEYGFSDRECHLSQWTGYSKPGSYVAEDEADWVQYIRNCY